MAVWQKLSPVFMVRKWQFLFFSAFVDCGENMVWLFHIMSCERERAREMGWLIWIQSELAFTLCRLWPFQPGTPLNDYCKHSRPLLFNDDKFHSELHCVRTYLLRLVFTLFWDDFVYLSALCVSVLWGFGLWIQALENVSIICPFNVCSSSASGIMVCLFRIFPKMDWY